MIQEERIPSKELFDRIVSITIEEPSSPYRQMLQEVNEIDNRYFDDIIRDEDILSPTLNMELKLTVVNQFQTLADKLLDESNLKKQILEELHWRTDSLKFIKGENAANQELKQVASHLKEYARQRLLFIPSAPFTEEELESKFQKAKEITLLEKIFQNNEADVIDFHHALQSKTVWECQKLIEERIFAFLTQLAEAILP